MPLKLVQLCEQYINIIHNEPLHRFKPNERLFFYDQFGFSIYGHHFDDQRELIIKNVEDGRLILTEADRAFGWLAILTARKVLPIWTNTKPEDYEGNLAAEILTLAQELLLGRIDPYLAYKKWFGDYYHSIGNLLGDVNERTFYACKTAHDVLLAVLWGRKPIDYFDKESDQFNDENILEGRYRYSDFAANAVNAWAIIDENQVGDRSRWDSARRTAMLTGRTDVVSLKWLNRYKPVTFDPQKRLDFWEWWLTEAIPQAWELANSTYQPKQEGQ